MIGYPSQQLHEEVAYLAYYLSWSYDQVMELEHGERRGWVTEVAKLNERTNEMVGGPWH